MTVAEPAHADRAVATTARVSLIATATFLVLLAVLHVIKPDIAPSWRFISEYAIGDFAWIMTLAFLAWAVGHVTVFMALRPHVRSTAGRIGLGLLLVTAAGVLLAAVFPTDPITATEDAVTTHGKIHQLGGTLGLAMPFAVAFISWSLARNPAWLSARRPVVGAAVLAWIGFLVTMVSLGMMLSRSGGRFGPDVPVGWPNRFEVLASSVWLMVVAWHAIQRFKQRP